MCREKAIAALIKASITCFFFLLHFRLIIIIALDSHCSFSFHFLSFSLLSLNISNHPFFQSSLSRAHLTGKLGLGDGDVLRADAHLDAKGLVASLLVRTLPASVAAIQV